MKSFLNDRCTQHPLATAFQASVHGISLIIGGEAARSREKPPEAPRSRYFAASRGLKISSKYSFKKIKKIFSRCSSERSTHGPRAASRGFQRCSMKCSLERCVRPDENADQADDPLQRQGAALAWKQCLPVTQGVGASNQLQALEVPIPKFEVPVSLIRSSKVLSH